MDLNGDGKRDVISGSWPGQVFAFYGQKKGFSKGKRLVNVLGKQIKSGNASAVFSVDWDGDGDLDLLLGNIQGDVVWFENKSNDRKVLAFTKAKPVRVGKKAIKSAGDSGPCVVDWDGDGDLDLLIGDDHGDVLLYRNKAAKGAKGAPVLAKKEVLVHGEPSWSKAAKDGHGKRAKICVVDWNNDGRLDLLLGDYSYTQGGKSHGYVWLYLRKAKKPKQLY